MRSENDTQGLGDRRLRVEPGTQVLVSMPSMQRSLSLLPRGVTGNVVLVSSTPPATVERRLRERGLAVERVGLVPVTGSEPEYDGPLWTSEPVVPDDLTGLSMRFTSALGALDAGHGWVLFDALDVLAMYAHQDRVCRFFDHVTTAARDRTLRGVYTITGDALDDQLADSFARSVDRVVDAR
ncbi:hypothetical protein [Halomicrobium sp. LC1Hm]|uniref:DUF7504 family protein n=1 Tax=Halomicrobium sp. LC1Hm TaxID=2610902 RepID=UPI0012982D0C|nr:hypothetical protein [Halomicrobium sp. LC1Hm]QGA82789.1 KaiC-like protein ATPase [Halomicrobium sp. LC1Hm]